jgi:beta-xylosidase
VWVGDFPDPAVLFADDVYYAYATEGTLDARLQVLRSWDMVQWGPWGDALVDTPPWADQWWSWSPAVVEHEGRFLMYYSARHTRGEVQCVSVAVAPSPEGRFVDTSSRPLICDPDAGGAIDPSPFVDDDGSRYLLWKVDGVAVGKPTLLLAQSLAADGLALTGEPTVLAAADQTWEQEQVEAPSMARIGATYVLLYSGNWWATVDYAIGGASCATPTGPCRKHQGPLATSRPGVRGPGGAEFFRNGDGALLVAYHAWADEVGGSGHRGLFIDTADDLVGEILATKAEDPEPLGTS